MKTNWRNMIGYLAAVIFVGLPLATLAGGYRLPDQDAFATARGEAFVATADNPSAIYYNPAGITQLEGQNFRVGFYSIDLEPNYKSPITGNRYGNQDNLHAIPQLFYTISPTNLPLTFGLGVYSPFGLGVKWPQDTGFRTLGTESSLTCATVNPVVALKLSPTFSLAGGITFNYAMIDLRQGLFSQTTPTDGFRFDGSGWDVGYNLGLLWKPHDKVAIGLTYRSALTVDLKGHTEDFVAPLSLAERTSAHAQLPIPATATVGISYRPTPKWNFEFDADYADWGSVRTLVVQQTQPTAVSQGFGAYPGNANISLPLNWQSSWYYEFGATRYFDNGWHVSAGYIFNQNSTPDANYTPLVADLDKHFFSVGVGRKGKEYDFDVAYQFGYGTSTVTGSAPSAAGQTADGNYEFISHALSVSVGWHF